MEKLLNKLNVLTSLSPVIQKLNFATVSAKPQTKNTYKKRALESAYLLFADIRNNYSTMRSNTFQREGNAAGRRLKINSINIKKYLNKYTISLLVVAFVVGSIIYIASASGGSGTQTAAIKEPTVKGIISESSINKEFLFPLTDAEGEVISNIKFEIVDASLRDVVSVQGQKAYPTENKLFLILGVKITNDLDQPIEMNTKDYARLVVNGNQSELLAPEMHNDPVEIQAISTKKTRLGFSVDREDKDFVLKIGEINGEKQDVPLTLNK